MQPLGEPAGRPGERPEPLGRPAPAPPGGPPPTLVGTLDPPPPPPPAPPTGVPLWGIVAAIAVGVWTVAVATLTQAADYVLDLLLAATFGRLAPSWVAPIVAVLGAGAIAVPAALLGWLPRSPGVRAAGRTWMLAGAAFGALALVRAVPPARHELYLATLAAVALALAVPLRRRGGAADGPLTAALLGLAGGLATLLPWAWLAALGGAVESVLAVVAALTVGRLAGGLLAPLDYEGSWTRQVLLTGLVAGVALAPLAAGVGGTGVSLTELLMLPPLGFAAAALRALWGSWALTPLVGTAAAGPLLFVDPEETLAVVGLRDVGFWALIAALMALAVVVVLGVAYGAMAAKGIEPHRWLAAGAAALLAVGVAGVYAGPGRPGLHGDRLFVVLRQQADLTGLESIADRGERLRRTYRRLVDAAQTSQVSIRRDLRRLRIGFTPYYLVNGVEVDAGPTLRAWLATRSDVDRVLDNPVLRPLPAPEPPLRGDSVLNGPQWNVQSIHADRVWAELAVTGSGVVIGTSDSGVDGAHPALRAQFRGGDDSWYDPWRASRSPTDYEGHGTHTLGSALGAGGIGVAPGAHWTGCVNLERNLGNAARYLDCLQFMLAPFPPGGDPWRDGRPERAPHVLTNSWGCPRLEGCDQGALRPALAAFAAAGVFFVAAAGNSGPFCGSISDPPAPYPEAFTVGAVDRQGSVANFSARGRPGLAKPDLVAPGTDIVSALPGGGYGPLDGTSMAAPHVAGVVALMWSANPRLVGDVRRTAEILRRTATPARPASGPEVEACGGDASIAGAGIVDAYAAVLAARG